MSVYHYSGVSDQGKDVSGTIDAENPKSARVKLRQNGIFPAELSEGTSSPVSSIGKPLSPFRDFGLPSSSTLLVFTKQCGLLLEANVPLMKTLSMLINQFEDRGFRHVLSDLRESIKGGKSFSDALSVHPRIFSSMYVQMIKAAEAGGVLSEGLRQLAVYLERQAQLKNRLINTLTYPALLACVGCLILIALVTFVIPQITGVFSDMEEALPFPTVLLISFSSFLNQFWLELSIVLFLCLVGSYWFLSTAQGRLWFDRRVIALPVIGKILLHAELSRFAQTLGTLLQSGVSLLDGLHIAKKVMSNQCLEKLIEQTITHVREGQMLTAPLHRNKIIPALFVNMIAVGEQTGDLDTMLLKVGQAYDIEVEMSLTRWLALLEPLLVLLMGCVVLFIVLAILLPLFQMSQIIH